MNKKTKTVKQVKKESVKNLQEPINFKTKPYTPFSITRWRQFLNHYLKYQNRFFIIMQRTNGTIDARFVYHQKNMFVYEKGIYIIDRNFMKWSDSLNAFVGHYTQGISLPINTTVDEETLKSRTESDTNVQNVIANIDPKILYSTVNSEMVQKVMQGEELGNIFANLKLLAILILVGVIGIIIMLYNKLF